jgi:hypothetical protein
MYMDNKVIPLYGAGTYVLWQERLYRVLYTMREKGQSYLIAIRYVDAMPIEREDEYEVIVSARQVRRSPWH